jgi:hypothetical protein
MWSHCTIVHYDVISLHYCTLMWSHCILVHCGVISRHISTLLCDLIALLYTMMWSHCILVHCGVISLYASTLVWSHDTIVHYDVISLHYCTLWCDLIALLYTMMWAIRSHQCTIVPLDHTSVLACREITQQCTSMQWDHIIVYHSAMRSHHSVLLVSWDHTTVY